MLESLDVYKEIVSKDFDVSNESNSVCQKRLKSYCKKYLFRLVSKELNHFGVIAGLFRQIGGHNSRFVVFFKTFHYKND